MKKLLLLIPVLWVLLLWWCVQQSTTTITPSYASESQKLSDTQEKLIKSNPTPVITESLERKNIAKRVELFNKSDKISYIYLVSYWKVMAFYPIKWKVSSVSSYLTPQEKLVSHNWKECDYMWNWSAWYTIDCISVQAPDIDWSYWTNWDWIFFFTTEWVYVEWKWEYMLVDQPLKLSTQPEIIYNLNK
jgi:hypothetical protein